MLSVALDVMGGDHAPAEVLEGAKMALQEFPIFLSLIGPEDIVRAELAKITDFPSDRYEIIHAPDIVGMSESPSLAFRKKKQSSIQVGLNRVKSGENHGFVSAGNTGAVMAASIFTLGRIPGVERPAIATVLPSQSGPTVMLDMGSTMDCKPQHLSQFAVMGKYFSKILLGIESPRIALLNIGEEADKGDMAVLETYEILQSMPNINFIGNLEGKDILLGKADVIVCDGFVGNVVLKFGEGISTIFIDFFKTEAKKSFLSLLGLLFLKTSLKRFMKSFDYQEYGGAPLLGVNGVSIIAHGKSKRIAIKNAIRSCVYCVDQKMVEQISEALMNG